MNPGYQEGTTSYYDIHASQSEPGSSAATGHPDPDSYSQHSDGGEGLRQRPLSSRAWAREETQHRDAAILLENLPSKQFGKDLLAPFVRCHESSIQIE